MIRFLLNHSCCSAAGWQTKVLIHSQLTNHEPPNKIYRLTLLLPRALLLIPESWLATISTLLEVMGILVLPSSPVRQLKTGQRTFSLQKNIHIFTSAFLEWLTAGLWKATHILWVSWTVPSVEMGLVESDMLLPSSPAPSKPFSSPLNGSFLWSSLDCTSEEINESSVDLMKSRWKGKEERDQIVLVFVVGKRTKVLMIQPNVHNLYKKALLHIVYYRYTTLYTHLNTTVTLFKILSNQSCHFIFTCEKVNVVYLKK